MSRPRHLVAAVALAVAALSASGCGFHGIYSLPLPGAVANGGNTYTFKVEFSDVLDLVPYSAVKANAADVGHVKSVALQNGHAVVTCQVLDSLKLPANAVARVEQTSILGEKFVELEAPKNEPPRGRLANGATIPLSRTDTDASVEEVLGALSALLTDGGVQQIHTIAHEVNTALTGRTAVSRDLLTRLRDFAGGLDNQKHQIVTAIQGVDALARTVRGQENQLIGALDRMPAALQVLTNDRKQLTTMLVSLRHFGDVAVRVIHASKASLLANLHNLRPTLDKLGRVGNVIPKTLEIIITYPTADTVEQEYAGDYGNLSLTIDLSHQSLATFLKGLQLPTSSQPAATRSGKRSTGGAGSAGSVTKRLTHPLHRLHPKRTIHKLLKPVIRRSPGTGISGLLLGAIQ